MATSIHIIQLCKKWFFLHLVQNIVTTKRTLMDKKKWIKNWSSRKRLIFKKTKIIGWWCIRFCNQMSYMSADIRWDCWIEYDKKWSHRYMLHINFYTFVQELCKFVCYHCLSLQQNELFHFNHELHAAICSEYT